LTAPPPNLRSQFARPLPAMSAVEESSGLSKSARKRANKKARDAAGADGEVEEAAPAPPPAPAAPKSKAKAKAEAPAPAAKAEPKAKAAEPKAKEKAKAASKSAPAAPAAAAPKAKAAAAEPKAAEAPVAPKAAVKPEAKGKAAKSKAKATKVDSDDEPAPPPKKEGAGAHFVSELDDGKGGEWDVATGLSNKQAKRKEKADQKKAEAKFMTDSGFKPGQQVIPGMSAPIPGMAPDAKGGQKAAVSQAVTQTGAAVGAALAAAEAAKVAAASKPESSSSTATIKVPEAKIGRIIGPKGSNIKMITEKTGCTRIDTSGEIITVLGNPQSVTAAEAALRELIEKGYCSLFYENFVEGNVSVHPSVFPDLIGKQGAIIRKIKDELNVEVGIPQVPKNASKDKKFKVTLAGANDAVEKAKTVVTDICMYGHHELTHPGVLHEELDVATWQYAFLIGKGGSEMRHIQNNYHVRVNIPRDTSMNQNVVVIGEKADVERAKVYIEKLIWSSDMPRGRDKAEGAVDTWGDEEADEPWMDQYMYKR